jgi:electron transfer flavoprotein-quinone oxidoreductase
MGGSAKLDAIVVGGGPAGISAAIVMARAGMDVVVMERGGYAGAKNVSGLLYSTVLKDLVPDFPETAPLERPVVRRSLAFIDKDMFVSLSFGSSSWSSKPYHNNAFVVYRSQFDRWYAKRAEEEGATVLEGTVVDGLIYEGRKVSGVRVRGDEDFHADLVVLADGANCPVTEEAIERLGIGPKVPQRYSIGVKEVVAIPKGTIEDRFGIGDDEGAALDFIGSPFGGLIGGGFIYTGKETVAVGFVATLDSVRKSGLNPNDIIEGFKRHPEVSRYIEGGDLLEYSAHLLPEGGFNSIPRPFADGLMIAGDAAGFLNMAPLLHQGSNLAMESGRIAGEVAVEAWKKEDFSASSLSSYERRLKESFVLWDLRRYRDVPKILEEIPEIFSVYPRSVCNAIISYFSISPEPRPGIGKIARELLKGIPKLRLVRDITRIRKMI